MFDFSGAKIDKLMVHGVGNRLKEDGVIISQSCVGMLGPSVTDLLGKYFFQQSQQRNKRTVWDSVKRLSFYYCEEIVLLIEQFTK